MTPERCPHCGAELDRSGATSPAIRDSWEALRGSVPSPRSVGEQIAGPPEAGATWWLPSLLYLAYGVARPEAQAVIDELAARRDELSYAVVEEETDDVVGLTIQPWPLIDRQGRLRFPIGDDPLQVEVRRPELADRLLADRRRWRDLGLLQEQLATARVQIGDAYALVVAPDPAPWAIETLRHPDDDRRRHLGGLPPRDGSAAGAAVPIVDVTWDAREAGKLAHYAAAVGVVADEPAPAMAAVAHETEARYMVALARGVDPRDVPPEEVT